MKGLFIGKINRSKVMPVVVCCMLAACGSGAGDSAGNNSGCDTTAVIDTLQNANDQIISRDGRARIYTTASFQVPISVLLSVSCNTIGNQIGNSYVVSLSGTADQIKLEINYGGLGVETTNLALGLFDSSIGDTGDWVAQFANHDPVLELFTLSAPQGDTDIPARYAVFSPSGGGGGDTVPPTRPTNVTVTVRTSSIDISWSASTDDASGISSYLIQRTPPGQQVGVVNGTTTSYTDLGTEPLTLVHGTTYCYTVTAVDGSPNQNRSAPSSAVCRLY